MITLRFSISMSVGYLLDVVWLMPTITDFPILERPDAFLFSVLRRLEVWHNARVTIMLGKGLEGKDHPSLVHWKTFIESRVVELRASPDGTDTKVEDILSQSASLAWQGQVKYISSRVSVYPLNPFRVQVYFFLNIFIIFFWKHQLNKCKNTSKSNVVNKSDGIPYLPA